MTRIIYMEKTPHLKGKARRYGWNYRKMALVRLQDDFSSVPKMISKRAKGVAEIIEVYVKHVGTTHRSEGHRIREEMKAYVRHQG